MLLGITFLFWGAMCERPFIGLLCALFVEARHWLKLRWDFDESAYEGAWKISFALTLLTGVLIWMDGTRYLAVLVLLTWMPALLLPLQFVQAYGTKDSMDLAAFSMIAKRSRIRNRRLGLITNPVRMNFGNILVVVALLAATVEVRRNHPLFLPGIVVLSTWALWSTGRCRWRLLAPVMVVAGLLAVAGEVVLTHLENTLHWGRHGGREGFNANYHTTKIGQSGQVILSPEVIWRLKVPNGGMPPLLLQTATFNTYVDVSWQTHDRKFEEIDPSLIGEQSYHVLVDGMGGGRLGWLPAYTLRGTVSGVHELPLAGDAVALHELTAERVERNAQGALRITPSQPVVECGVVRMDGRNPESPPGDTDMVRLATYEKRTIMRVIEELGLRELPDLESRLTVLRHWFHTRFRYTLDLTIRQPTHRERTMDDPMPSALTQFLTDVRAGHCEYFATSATLILQQLGHNSRYAIGFSVMERDSNGGYLIRGTHRHAWCRVWDESNGRWINFDPTPPDWSNLLPKSPSWTQRFKDALKHIREDFYLWRTQPTNEMILMVLIGGIAVALGVWILRRLWKSRNRIDEAMPGHTPWTGDTVTTPLHALERLLRRHLGERPAGQPYSVWVSGLGAMVADAGQLNELIMLHQRMRYDPLPCPEECRDRLQELVAALELELRRISAAEAGDEGEDVVR